MKIPLNNIHQLKTFGMSMFPLLHDGDIVYLKKKKFSNIDVNDIVCIKKNKIVTTHRVIYKSQMYLVTKGDYNFISDGKVYKDQIIGVVEKIKRNGNIYSINDLYLFQSTIYFDELKRIKKIFEKNRIDYLIFKGLPLYLHLTNSHPRRIYADCDVLIERNNFGKVEKLLKSLGYYKPDKSLSFIQKILKDKETEVSFVKIVNDIPIVIDLHVEIVLMPQLGSLNPLYPEKLLNSLTKLFFDNRKQITVLGEKFYILSYENLFLYLLLHLFHHCLIGTNRYELIIQVLRKPVKFSIVSSTIKNYKLDNYIYPCILLLKKYYSINIPQSFLESLSPKRSAVSYTRNTIMKQNIFNDNDRITDGIMRFKYFFYLSPYPLYRKVLIFVKIKVLWAILHSLLVKSKGKVSRSPNP